MFLKLKVFSCGIITLGCLVFGNSYAAPIPKVANKPEKVNYIVPKPGQYKLCFGGGEGDVWLYEGGGYRCSWYGNEWVGTYSFKDHVFEIRETRANDLEHYATYKANQKDETKLFYLKPFTEGNKL